MDRTPVATLVAVLALVLACLDAGAQSFVPGESMHMPRTGHTATALADGGVLVVGGSENASAERYDPSANRWSLTTPPSTIRSEHTATMLSDGKVLVVGGIDSKGVLAVAELYDPATDEWVLTGSLAQARRQHSATLLSDGSVLVAGGFGATSLFQTLSSTEIYNPGPGQFSVGPSLLVARGNHRAAALLDGRVLVTGGLQSFIGGFFAGAELFDPVSSVWTELGSWPGVEDHSVTILRDGRVLVVGGFNTRSYFFVPTRLFDPLTGDLIEASALNEPRSRHTATLLRNGQVLVAGGRAIAGTLASAELWNPDDNSWEPAASLRTARADHTETRLPDGRVLIVGGEDIDGQPLASSEIYDPSAQVAPQIDRVLHGAAFLPFISPGAIVSVFGNFAETSANSPDIPLRTKLNGISITFDDVPAALFGVFGEDFGLGFHQANVQVPWDLTLDSDTVEVRVHWASESGEIWSDAFEVAAGAASPGIFEFPTDSGQAIVTNFKQSEEDGVIPGSYAQPVGAVNPLTGQPAAIGGIVTIWLTGLGAVTPAAPTGDIPGLDAPLSETVNKVRVLIGAVEAQIIGKPVLHPNLVALNQINAMVSPGTPTGDQVPVVVEVDCGDGKVFRSKEGVTIAVRPAP